MGLHPNMALPLWIQVSFYNLCSLMIFYLQSIIIHNWIKHICFRLALVILFAVALTSTIVGFGKRPYFFPIFFLNPSLREASKYYFADFVRKGGTPPPFTDFFSGKKGVTDLGGTPPPTPPVYGFFFQRKGTYGFGGYPPPPLRTKSAK